MADDWWGWDPDTQLRTETAVLIARLEAFRSQNPPPNQQDNDAFARSLVADLVETFNAFLDRRRQRFVAALPELVANLPKRRRGRPRKHRPTLLGGSSTEELRAAGVLPPRPRKRPLIYTPEIQLRLVSDVENVKRGWREACGEELKDAEALRRAMFASYARRLIEEGVPVPEAKQRAWSLARGKRFRTLRKRLAEIRARLRPFGEAWWLADPKAVRRALAKRS